MDTGYYLAAGAMPAGVQRQANLRAGVDAGRPHARAGAGAAGSGVFHFIVNYETFLNNKL